MKIIPIENYGNNTMLKKGKLSISLSSIMIGSGLDEISPNYVGGLTYYNPEASTTSVYVIITYAMLAILTLIPLATTIYYYAKVRNLEKFIKIANNKDIDNKKILLEKYRKRKNISLVMFLIIFTLCEWGLFLRF